MSIRDYLREEYKELLTWEYETKSVKHFLESIKEITKKIKEYKIIKIKVKVEIEGIKISGDEVFFP